jgi:iron complex outermembrane receptor protein
MKNSMAYKTQRISATRGALLPIAWRSRIDHCLMRGLVCLLAGLLTLTEVTVVSAAPRLPEDLMDMSLEALMDIEITSAAKKPQKKSEAAAAIFVITNDDLRRWGVMNIPDALRRVPGLQVARIDAGKWAITARGFNSRFANKLLVLIDGRSIYTPLFAGVYWEANEVMLEDVERIEVIRGPGGSLWGANAVNGVINIITKSAHDTQGTLVTAGVGNEERGFASLRYGKSGSNGKDFRVYGKFHSTDSGEAIDTGLVPPVSHDDKRFAQTGFRMDWDNGDTNSHTMQGDLYEGSAGQQLLLASSPTPVTENADYQGGNLLYRWTHRSSPDSNYTLQAYFDAVSLKSAALIEDRNTLDIDFQQHRGLGDRHDLVWGLNYRSVRDHPGASRIYSLNPPKRTVNLFTAFIQDEISLLDDRLKLTLGSKFEHNDFTGQEAQPNIRVAWKTDEGNTLWGAVSRAVRTPARGEHDISMQIIPQPPAPPPLTVMGNRDFDSESLVAWELGYRFSLARQLSVDLTAFYNKYDDLRTVDIYTPAPPLEASFDNNMEGNTQGFEIDAHWNISPWLELNANYTRLEIDLDLKNGSTDLISPSAEDASPEHQANVWIAADLNRKVELDAGLRYVGSLKTPGFPTIDDYIALDMRLAWTPKPGLEVSIIGQNLLDSSHPEFNPDFIFSLPTEVERSVTGKVTLRF